MTLRRLIHDRQVKSCQEIAWRGKGKHAKQSALIPVPTSTDPGGSLLLTRTGSQPSPPFVPKDHDTMSRSGECHVESAGDCVVEYAATLRQGA